MSLYLSTHDLTQRSTQAGDREGKTENLSTHDLTQRSTQCSCSTVRDERLSTHDLTQRSTRLRLTISFRTMSFNSRPHAEVDGAALFDADITKSFNSRPHAEVDLLLRSASHSCLSFNSRPHAEVDWSYAHSSHQSDLSTHDLTQRSTRGFMEAAVENATFQLTTSRRGRR